MKLNYLTLMACLFLFSTNGNGAEYIYRDLMANTLPQGRCESKAEAEASALKPVNFNRYAKKFCQTQGYGWHLTKVKNDGKSVCEECPEKKQEYRCHYEDVVVQCKRLKPGSVGMLPGEG